MTSKRIYKETKCANPECAKKFAPHDRRQIYCTGQCRINSNNDKAHTLNKQRNMREKSLRASDRLLKMLISSGFYKNEKIEESVLLAFHIDQSTGSLSEHVDTGGIICWFHAYGLELIDLKKRFYTIHIRTM